MTIAEFQNLKWQFSSHFALADKHVVTHYVKYNRHHFTICKHVPSMEYKMEHPYARSYTHYVIDDTVYKTKKKLIEAIKEL